MLKIKEEKMKDLVDCLNGVEKTHFIYFEEVGVRVNKHNGIIELGNFKYSAYENLGKSKYNIPDIVLEMCKADMVEKVVEDE